MNKKIPKNKVALWKKIIGSFFFLGKIKGGGTYSSVAAGLLLFFFLNWTSPYYYIILFVVLSLALFLSFEIDDDPSWFTFDEVAGTVVMFAFHNKDLSILIIGLILFRLFDIFKIPIIKKVEHFKTGIVLDDIIAGLLASIFLFVLHSIKTV
jgi:phosphatidylglycerophosphatase A